MRKDIPMILCPHRNTRSFWSVACPSFVDIIIKFPFIWHYLFLLPFSFIIIPLVAYSYFHASIFLAFKLFVFIIRVQVISVNLTMYSLNSFLAHKKIMSIIIYKGIELRR